MTRWTGGAHDRGGPDHPPLGLNVYVLKGVAPNISMGDIFRGCGWFVLVDIANVAILIAFPQIILFLPETMIK